VPATKEPLPAVSRISLTVDGAEIATFSELVSLEQRNDPVEVLAETGPLREPQRTPVIGRPVPPTVTLRRGVDSNTELWTWHETVRQGDLAAARRSASLTMFAATGKPVVKFRLENAWPSKLEVGALKAGAASTLIETVTLTCESLQRVAP
jgi:phage tail-like protein